MLVVLRSTCFVCREEYALRDQPRKFRDNMMEEGKNKSSLYLDLTDRFSVAPRKRHFCCGAGRNGWDFAGQQSAPCNRTIDHWCWNLHNFCTFCRWGENASHIPWGPTSERLFEISKANTRDVQWSSTGRTDHIHRSFGRYARAHCRRDCRPFFTRSIYPRKRREGRIVEKWIRNAVSKKKRVLLRCK